MWSLFLVANFALIVMVILYKERITSSGRDEKTKLHTLYDFSLNA